MFKRESEICEVIAQAKSVVVYRGGIFNEEKKKIPSIKDSVEDNNRINVVVLLPREYIIRGKGNCVGNGRDRKRRRTRRRPIISNFSNYRFSRRLGKEVEENKPRKWRVPLADVARNAPSLGNKCWGRSSKSGEFPHRDLNCRNDSKFSASNNTRETFASLYLPSLIN